MAHAQQQVLDAVQTLLAAGGTAASTRVYVDLPDPLQANQLPAILIRESESGESAEVAFLDGNQRRELEVDIACVVASSSDAPVQARNLGLAVEKLVAASATITAMCKGGWLITSSKPASSGVGDRFLAAREQRWRFVYFVSPTAPDIII